MHPIPDEALDDRHAFVGTSGSGKTYNAGTAVERLQEQGHRTGIVDPLGGWWGLRMLADGKTASDYDVVIFGGPHGDLPLTENAGALIGETCAGMSESFILDLSELGTKAAERRFMLALLTALYRKTSGEPLHLVIDEADMFDPWCAPYVGRQIVRVIWDGRDITPEPNHRLNRWSCSEANRINAETARILRLPKMPYYHYDAIMARAIKLDATPATRGLR